MLQRIFREQPVKKAIRQMVVMASRLPMLLDLAQKLQILFRKKVVQKAMKKAMNLHRQKVEMKSRLPMLLDLERMLQIIFRETTTMLKVVMASRLAMLLDKLLMLQRISKTTMILMTTISNE